MGLSGLVGKARPPSGRRRRRRRRAPSPEPEPETAYLLVAVVVIVAALLNALAEFLGGSVAEGAGRLAELRHVLVVVPALQCVAHLAHRLLFSSSSVRIGLGYCTKVNIVDVEQRWIGYLRSITGQAGLEIPREDTQLRPQGLCRRIRRVSSDETQASFGFSAGAAFWALFLPCGQSCRYTRHHRQSRVIRQPVIRHHWRKTTTH